MGASTTVGVLITLAASTLPASVAHAQRVEPAGVRPPTTRADSAVVVQRTGLPDSLTKPPITPGRAFFTSLILPGYAQAKLERPTASMLFAIFEVFSLGMLRKSAQDLREAKGAPKDSIYIGLPTDPATGNPTSNGYILPRYTQDRINARKTHYEDWVAAIIANHLLSGADAYVSANLWDFRANVSVDPDTKRAKVGASRSF
jgi:hypothetical protein